MATASPLRALPPVETTARADVVDALEALLAPARSGEIRGFAMAAAASGRCTGSLYVTGDATISDLYLAIDRVKLRLLDEGA